MNRGIGGLVVVALIVCRCALATIINVPDDYGTIQQGIDSSSDYDTVLVQPGTYFENVNFNGHSIVVGSMFLITENSSYIYSTVIDGASSGSVVTVNSGETDPAAIVGFTLRNGSLLSFLQTPSCALVTPSKSRRSFSVKRFAAVSLCSSLIFSFSFLDYEMKINPSRLNIFKTKIDCGQIKTFALIILNELGYILTDRAFIQKCFFF